MLDFRRPQSPLLNRREQMRLLVLVALLGFMLFAIQRAAQPSSWYWMLGNPGDRVSTGPSPEANDPGQPLVINRQPADSEPSVADDSSPEPATDFPDSPSHPLPLPETLDRTQLSEVQDNSPISYAERSAYFHTLAYLVQTADESNGEATRNVTFASLFADPSSHRGERIALRGHVRRVTEFEAGANSYGFKKLYEAWLFTSQSGTNPYVVVCSSVPRDFPLGDGVVEEVRTEGIFFKKYAYAAGDGMRLAPLVLADRLVWLRPELNSTQRSLSVYLLGIATAALVGLAVSVWLFAQARRRFVTPEADRFAGPSREELESLEELDSPTSEGPDFEGL